MIEPAKAPPSLLIIITLGFQEVMIHAFAIFPPNALIPSPLI